MKKSKKKVLWISICSILAAIIVLPLGFVGIVSLMASNRSIGVSATNIENKTGLVQQYGKNLYDENGNRLLLRGVNAGNLLVSEGWLSPFSVGESLDEDGNVIFDHDGLPTYPELPMEETIKGFNSNPNLNDEQRKELISIYRDNWFSEVDYSIIKEMGLNTIRLPFYWRDILDEKDGIFTRKDEDKAFGYLDSFLEGCYRNKIYCILDLHGTPGGQNPYEHSGDTTKVELWTNEVYQDATADLWAYVAYHYSNTRADLSPIIASYDLMNEPCTDFNDPGSGSDTRLTYPVFDKIYKAIRSQNDNHVITIEGMWGYHSFEDPKDYGWENIMHETHIYNWDHDKIPYWLYNAYLEVGNWGKDFDVPFFIGEFTFFDNKEDWNKQLSLFEKRGYSWTFWNYKAASNGWWTTTWSVVTQKLNLGKDKMKVNLKLDDYETIKEAFEATKTSNCEKSNTYNYVKDFIEANKD